MRQKSTKKIRVGTWRIMSRLVKGRKLLRKELIGIMIADKGFVVTKSGRPHWRIRSLKN